MERKRAQSKKLRIKKLSDLTVSQQHYLRSFLPPMLEISAPYVINKWIDTFDVCSYAASVCRNWRWLDAHLVSLLLPYPQEKCVDACFYMYETSLRVTTFKDIKKEELENLGVRFNVFVSDIGFTQNKVEVVSLKTPPSSTQPNVKKTLSVLILYASSTKDFDYQLSDHIHELGNRYEVAAFLVPCNCGKPTTYNMDRLIKCFGELSTRIRKALVEKQCKWRFWLVHNHRNSLLNINDPINWAFGECASTLMESYLSEE